MSKKTVVDSLVQKMLALVKRPSPQGVEILTVLKDRQKETVEEFLGAMPSRLKSTINKVCTDMYGGYVNAAREHPPNAKIVVDRFHVARIYRDCADMGYATVIEKRPNRADALRKESHPWPKLN